MKWLFFFIVLLAWTNPVQGMQVRNSLAVKAEIDKLGERYLDLGRFSGRILVARNGTVVYNEDFGLADYEKELPFSPETSFEAGELSKLFNKAVLLKMVSEGRIDSGQKLYEFIPEIDEELTFAQYLNGQLSGKKIAAQISFLLIEKISEKSYQEEIRDLADQLGLENSYTGRKGGDKEAKGYLFHNYRGKGLELELSPGDTLSSGVKTTPQDLLKLLQYLPEREFKEEGYLQNGGFSYAVIRTATSDIIIFSNRRHPVAGEMGASIKAILDNNPYELPLPRKEVKIDPSLLKNYSGSYQLNSEMSFTIINSNNHLYLEMGPQKVHLKPQSVNQFFMEQGDTAIRFLKNNDGKVATAELLDGFMTGKIIRKID